jgi:hypothetical protein
MRFLRRLAIPFSLALCAAVLATSAGGELVQQGNLRLAFNGRIAPKKLPRRVPAPVRVEMSGAISTADGGQPPQLRRISIAFNRFGTVTTAGLPRCDAAELEQTTSAGAMAACRGALVGHGGFRAYVNFPGHRPVAVVGEALAFNATERGRRAILLHIYGARPVQVTFVVPFAIHHVDKGQFGTVFTARIPKIAAHSGYVTDLSMTLGRRYRADGRRRSFLSARCAVPVGIPGAVFALARGTFVFSNGQHLSTALSRNCWAR